MKYYVYIHKSYFPKELWPKKIGQEAFMDWTVEANSRVEAAQKVWSLYGPKLLSLMTPWLNKLPRKVSLYVDSPKAGVGGKAGRLLPILVYQER